VALAFAVAFPATAFASRTITGRITAFTTTSLSVQDREIGVVSQATAPVAPKKDKGATSDLLTARQLTALIATAKTPADHVKLQKHYLALAARYEAEAVEHVADAQAYRKNPTFLESKTPGGPGTAAHCERFAELDRQAAKEARDLASAHEAHGRGEVGTERTSECDPAQQLRVQRHDDSAGGHEYLPRRPAT
jgi:hypothetical protein